MRLRRKQAIASIKSRHFDLRLEGKNSSSSSEVMVCDWDNYYMQCSGAGGWDPIDPGFGCCRGQVCFSSLIQSNTESDAFISAVSQRGDLLQTRPTRLQRVENVDHRSMTFSNAVLEALERAFDGQNGLEFRIERR